MSRLSQACLLQSAEYYNANFHIQARAEFFYSKYSFDDEYPRYPWIAISTAHVVIIELRETDQSAPT